VVELQLGLAELRVWTACSIDQRAWQNGDSNTGGARLNADGSSLWRHGTGKAAGYIQRWLGHARTWGSPFIGAGREDGHAAHTKAEAAAACCATQ
jgi:hypothetical protein